ncbi:MAG: thiolase family protein [Gemmatimonadota bacterium]|nr:thiolase family protein [Gemmatimonadota bacterium]
MTGPEENRPVIVDAVRTPFGRHRGALARVRPDDLAAIVIRALVDRTQLDVTTISDVILGCTNQAGEDSRNVARLAALLAGLPVETPGQTVNRLCGSGMQAVASAAHAIRAGEGDCFIAGGVESMTRAPWVTLRPDEPFARSIPETADSTIGWRFTNTLLPDEWTISMGETAELVAARYGISREEQDAFALESQERTARAIAAGRLERELVPVPVATRGNSTTTVTRDEHPRPDVTVDSLSRLQAAFVSGGTVTAGSSSGINDGACALLVMSDAAAREAGHTVLARIVSSAVAGVAPDVMGIGPVPAARLALARAGIGIGDLDLIELNEAFAAQAIACIRELELPADKVNVNGGAIALGHPLGASGARLVTTLAHEMQRRGSHYGLATMCIGVGQGIAMVLEKP